MHFSRRDFLQLSLLTAISCSTSTSSRSMRPEAMLEGLYDIEPAGDVRILHTTDSHAQLLPVYFREPNINLGFDDSLNRPPHLVGRHFLEHFGIAEGTPLAHVFTYLNFVEEAKRYRKVGGYDYIATLIKKLSADFGKDNVLLLDGGDSWQGSATAYWTKGQDMVGAMNRLGYDAMVGHWEFTYDEAQIHKNIKDLEAAFLAQNVFLTEEALFEDVPVFDDKTGRAFPPYKMFQKNGHTVCVIGQAFPYTPIANPQRFIPNWSFGIRETELRELVQTIRRTEKPSAVILLSHNGMDVDLKLASQVEGIDLILGGHTHDAVPKLIEIKNPGNITYVMSGGSHGKFVGCFDLNLSGGKVSDISYNLLPVFPTLLESDASMKSYIDSVREPYLSKLNEKIGVAGELLYRRGNFAGTFDQVICDALNTVLDADISLSPGFRWGTSVLPGDDIRMEDLMNATAMTYPETYVTEMSGADIKTILEDVADNLFNADPYLQQGGDMVRVGGMSYALEPKAVFGKRVSKMTLYNGSSVEPGKKYKVAGWSTVGSVSPGRPIWEVVRDYITQMGTVNVKRLNQPELIGVSGNKGMEV